MHSFLAGILKFVSTLKHFIIVIITVKIKHFWNLFLWQEIMHGTCSITHFACFTSAMQGAHGHTKCVSMRYFNTFILSMLSQSAYAFVNGFSQIRLFCKMAVFDKLSRVHMAILNVFQCDVLNIFILSMLSQSAYAFVNGFSQIHLFL